MPENNETNVFKDDKDLYGAGVKPVPKPDREFGVDTKDSVFQEMIELSDSTQIDVSKINSFSSIARTRDQMYNMLDTMAEDAKVSAILTTFAADATETNEDGKVMWATSSDDKVAKYVNYLLETLNVDTNAYKWILSLCKYGDLYIRRYRESETEDLLSKDLKDDNNSGQLNEDVNVVAFSDNDKFVHYVEMIPNPAEIFELVRFGKTYAYVQAEINPTQTKENVLYNQFYRYRFNRNDVNVYQPTMFVHATLDDNVSRSPEEIQIFADENMDESKSSTYKVRRGQSILYDKFKLWRELTLLENSLLLNRVTKSSVIRLLKIKVNDMPKEAIANTLNRLKGLIEQKMAMKEGGDISEYTNPGPMENILYIPVRTNDIGDITQETLGGSDVDVKGIADIEYYQSEFYGSFGIPKQYFGATNDNTGFNGGTSLTIISAPYAKKVKRIQNSLCQAVTTLINLMLMDKKLNNYINNFEIRMQSPITQADIDRKDTVQGRVQIMGDILSNLSDLDSKDKLKVTKVLLSNIVSDAEIIEILQKRLDEMEAEENPVDDSGEENPFGGNDRDETESSPRRKSSVNSIIGGIEPEQSEEGGSDTELPNAKDLGVDFTKDQEEI